MARFEIRGRVEYAILEGITADDPLGEILYKRAQRQRDKPNPSKLRVGGKSKTYNQLMDELENEQMTKEVYEELVKRTKVLSIKEERDLRSSKKIMNMGLISYLFGDMERLLEEEQEKIKKAARSVRSFKEYLSPYLNQKLSVFPVIEDWNQEIFETSRTKSLLGLQHKLMQLRNVLEFKIKFEYLDNVNKVEILADKQLLTKHHDVLKDGSVFDLGDVLIKFQRKYG